MGPYRGGQAELVRVPCADFNALKLPGKPGDDFEDDFVSLADVFPTGYHATEQAHVGAGDTVAIWGVDRVDDRLARAAELGATPIDLRRAIPSKSSTPANRTGATCKSCAEARR